MPQLEHENSLQIVTNIRDGTQNACFNPRQLSLPVIRRMLTLAINDKGPNVSIIIEAVHGTTHILPNEIHQIRRLTPNQQASFIGKYTWITGNADRVIFLDCED